MNLSSLSLNPVYIAPSTWWQHVPIAHWLVAELKPTKIVELGTHYGVSFFSFCEAAQAFSADTFIFAIDTWEGDQHASYYGIDVFHRVLQHWEEFHRLRSQLIRATFDAALEYFEDNSIDVLHIDGLHTYEAVEHDYRTWLPKMKENSLILFHDINVRERGFGVWKLWQELKTDYATLEVSNGHGLGILILGEIMARNLNRLPPIVRALQSKGELLEKLANLTSKSSHLQALVEQAQVEAAQARAEAEQARAEAEQARAKAEQAKDEAEQARIEREQIRTEAEQAQAKTAQIDNELSSILESNAWRISAPARRFMDAMKSRTPRKSP